MANQRMDWGVADDDGVCVCGDLREAEIGGSDETCGVEECRWERRERLAFYVWPGVRYKE